MYSDLFDQLGRGRGGGSSADNEPPSTPPLVSFKAGRMTLEPSSDNATAGASSATSYQCTPDTSRGEVRLVTAPSSASATLQWQWVDRRTGTVQDTWAVPAVAATTATASTTTTESAPSSAATGDTPSTEATAVSAATATTTTASALSNGGTFVRVPTAHPTTERIYVWTSTSDSSSSDATPTYRMYWMQDEDESKDEEIVETVNDYLQGKRSTTSSSTSSGGAAAAAGGSSSSTRATTGAGGEPTVDALSSILENLGMPHDAGPAAGASTSDNTATTNRLTLADLQGAMRGIETSTSTTQQQQPPVALTDVITSDAIDLVLQDEAATARLVALLPPEQQSAEALRENISSPPLQQTLRALQMAIQPDATGDMSGYASVIANFQLDPNAGQTSLTQGNPLQAFLDCVLASVEQQPPAEAETNNDNQEMKEE